MLFNVIRVLANSLVHKADNCGPTYLTIATSFHPIPPIPLSLPLFLPSSLLTPSPPPPLCLSLYSFPHSSFSPPFPQTTVFVHVNRLDSVNTMIPYEYSKFDFCPLPSDSTDRDPSENLGQVLFGERLRASAYQVRHTHTHTRAHTHTHTHHTHTHTHHTHHTHTHTQVYNTEWCVHTHIRILLAHVTSGENAMLTFVSGSVESVHYCSTVLLTRTSVHIISLLILLEVHSHWPKDAPFSDVSVAFSYLHIRLIILKKAAL